MMTNDEILSLLRREVDQAMGYEEDELASERGKALDYYYGKMGETIDGRSSIVSMDVADTVHALLAQIMPMFRTSMLEFEPNGQEDEAQAQLESDLCCKLLMDNHGHKVLYSAAFDALLQSNGWIKVTIEEKQEVEEDILEGVDDVIIAQLGIQAEADGHFLEVTPLEEEGSWKVKRTVTEQELSVKSIAPDVMLFSPAWDQFEVDEIRFICERKLFTASDLKEMGLKQDAIDSIEEYADRYWYATEAREGQYQDHISQNYAHVQDAEQLKQCYDCYIRIDIDENGTSELRHILWGGEHIIVNEQVECHPYATGSPICIPHRIQGEGIYTLLKDVQAAKTNIFRSYVDNLEQVVTGRYGAVEGQVNMEDALSGRANGVVRVKRPDAFFPLPANDIGAAALQGMQYFDTVREQRGGASVDMNDADRQIMQASATAAAGLQANHEEMAGFYCSNLVHSLLYCTYKLIHKQLRYGMTGQIGAKLRGKWVQTNPGEWQERKTLKVTAGMTTKERANQVTGLAQVIQSQQMMLQAGLGGILTSHDKAYQAQCDWIRAANLGDPSQYLVDPSSQEAMQQAQQLQQQGEQEKQQAAQMQEQLITVQNQLEQAKLELDRWKHQTELDYKYFDSRLDAGVKMETTEAELTVQAIGKESEISQRDRAAVNGSGGASSN